MDRVEIILKDPFYKECLDKIEKMEQTRKFCRHGFRHLLDVARIAYILMLESGELQNFAGENDFNIRTAREIIYASALLHDIGRWKQYQTGEDHAVSGAEISKDILRRAGFNDKEIDIISTGIREHRMSEGDRSVLGKNLNRADKLSRMCTRCEARNECYKFEEMETAYKPLIY